MNTKDLITEAAEAYYEQLGITPTNTGHLQYNFYIAGAIEKMTHFLTHAKEKGYELVKVEGDVVGHDEAWHQEHLRVCNENEQLRKDVQQKDRVIAEWVELWEPINEAIENCPTLKLGDSKSQKAVEIIELFNAATK